MRRFQCAVLGAAAAIGFASVATAADMPVKAPPVVEEWFWRFNPSISFGYASFGSSSLSLSAVNGVGLAGLVATNWQIPRMSGYYIAGELPVALTDRLTLTLGGRWVSGSHKSTDEVVNNGVAVRTWDSDGRGWGTVDLQLAYALIKNPSAFLKNVSAIIGGRWDHQKIDFANPVVSSGGVANSPADTASFRADSYSPVFGLSATFMGFKSGIFGGDIKLSVVGSPWTRGTMSFQETFATPTFIFNFDGNTKGNFFKVAGEATLLSWRAGSRGEASLSLLADYTESSTSNSTVTMTRVGPGTTSDYNFSSRSRVTTVGLKGAVAF